MKTKETITYKITTLLLSGKVVVTGKVQKIIKEGTSPVFKKYIGKTLASLKKWLLKKTGEVYTERIYKDK